MGGATHEVQSSDGGQLRYELDGEGPTLVLAHGSFADRSTFRRLWGLIGDGRRLLLPVLRGHEDTGTPLPADHGIDTSEVRDLLTVLDAVRADRG